KKKKRKQFLNTKIIKNNFILIFHFVGRTFEVTNEEKKKLAWNANMDITQKKEEYNFEYDNNNNKHNKKKEEIKKEFKYLVPGERVKFSVIYDEKSNSSKAINVDYID
ncbi:hypothetical protein PFTANZ_00100, partial [Plasmodium falciparum Tanzania (2000708)]